MSLSSYDELLKQVESLKVENTHLRRELQDNSSHLTKLENEASTMKDVFSHLDSAMQDDAESNLALELAYQGQGQTSTLENGTDNLDQNSNSSNGKSFTFVSFLLYLPRCLPEVWGRLALILSSFYTLRLHPINVPDTYLPPIYILPLTCSLLFLSLALYSPASSFPCPLSHPLHLPNSLLSTHSFPIPCFPPSHLSNCKK
ncbi:hypothetical protein NP493_432g02014 [Ridgeia piscesae]|uniref:Adenomatous polyposis coli N-terminal dimerisation domain-containing protein n=1 Tax=Ridgeia piscesae TaxID=27915 RepID=A0AAD9L0G2_RIDPI|nr:hypothetical protein NP493_432g02014 [Ridgeia piscesae]